MLEQLKGILIQMASYFSLYEIGLLLAIFFVFIMFFTLGLLLRGRRFIARFFFFLSALAIFSTPLVLQLMMQKVLYVSKVEITNAYAMQYTKGFFVAGNITNEGKVPFNECQIAVNEVIDEKNSIILKIWNTLFPKKSFSAIIDVDIQVGQSEEFATIVPDFSTQSPFYRIYIDCYLSNKFAQKMQDKKQESEHIITPFVPKALD